MCMLESDSNGISAEPSISSPISDPSLISIVATSIDALGVGATAVFVAMYLFTAMTANSPTSTAATAAIFVLLSVFICLSFL